LVCARIKKKFGLVEKRGLKTVRGKIVQQGSEESEKETLKDCETGFCEHLGGQPRRGNQW